MGAFVGHHGLHHPGILAAEHRGGDDNHREEEADLGRAGDAIAGCKFYRSPQSQSGSEGLQPAQEMPVVQVLSPMAQDRDVNQAGDQSSQEDQEAGQVNRHRDIRPQLRSTESRQRRSKVRVRGDCRGAVQRGGWRPLERFFQLRGGLGQVDHGFDHGYP